MQPVVHELHIDSAPESIALAEANMCLAFRTPVGPGHMCQTLLQCRSCSRRGSGSCSERGSGLIGLPLSQPLQGGPETKSTVHVSLRKVRMEECLQHHLRPQAALLKLV